MSIKEKFIKAKEKVVSFVEEHPKITGVLIFMGCITGAAVISAVRSENSMNSDDWVELQNGILNDVSKSDKQDWEQYEENWNKVNEFAETLKLLPGESFIIEDAEQYRDCTDFSQCDFSKPIVSHLVYNEGIYPPEE